MSKRDAYDVLDLKALRCFSAMARQGSLTGAGRELGISESAVSQRIKALEARLGTKLYEARGGRVRLTRAGERTLGMALSLFEQIEEFEETVADEEAAGIVSLATNDAVSRYLLPDVALALSRAFPRSRLRLLHRTPDEVLKLVSSNEVDLGIVPARALPDGLVFHAWKTFAGYVIIPNGHPLLRRGTPDMEDLLTMDVVSRYPLVVSESTGTLHNRITKVLSDHGLPYNVNLEVGSIETVKHYVACGLGIGVVSGLCLTPGEETQFARVRIPAELAGTTTYGVVLRRDKHLLPVLDALLRQLGLSPATPGHP